VPRSRRLDDTNSTSQKKSVKPNKQIRGNSIKDKLIDPAKLKKTAFVGLDVHKKTIRISAMGADGNELANWAINNTTKSVEVAFKAIPKTAIAVMESSSVWKDLYFQIRDILGYKTILSNPRYTKMIAESKKKTDKVDAKILASMARGGYIAECYVPTKKSMDNRDLVRHRQSIIRSRTVYKNFIHGILLQRRIQISHTPFSTPWIAKVRKIDDHRIDINLELISAVNNALAKIDVRVRNAARIDLDAVLLMSIPGIGPYTALVVSSEIDGIERFNKSHKLCAYAGVVPSVKSSGDSIKYGPITHHGSSILRWVMTECIHSHVRFAKNSSVTKFYHRLSKKRGKSKATVAAASLLLRIIHNMLRERRTFVDVL